LYNLYYTSEPGVSKNIEINILYLTTIIVYYTNIRPRDGEQRVLPFAVVTAFDLLALFIFLFKRQIGRWHKTCTSDIEQGHIRPEGIDDALATPGRGDEQREQDGLRAMPAIRGLPVMQDLGYDIPHPERNVSMDAETLRLGQPGGLAADGRRSDLVMESGDPRRPFAGGQVAVPRYNEWTAGPMPAGRGEDPVDQQPSQAKRRSGFSIAVGMDSGFGDVPCRAQSDHRALWSTPSTPP